MWEHIHGLNLLYAICHIKGLQVACLSSRIAANVYNALWVSTQYGLYYIWVHSGTWWVGNDNNSTSMLGNKLVVKDVFHIACIELGVVDIVYLRVYLCILYCLRHILDTYNLTSLTSHKVGYGSSSCIKVVEQVVTSTSGKVGSSRV